MSPQSNTPESQRYVGTENFLTVRLLYHLWRIDSAARAFPRNLTEEKELNVAKARWTIGLTLEMVRLLRLWLDISYLSTAWYTRVGSRYNSCWSHDRIAEPRASEETPLVRYGKSSTQRDFLEAPSRQCNLATSSFSSLDFFVRAPFDYSPKQVVGAPE